jgi:hypothetical protein
LPHGILLGQPSSRYIRGSGSSRVNLLEVFTGLKTICSRVLEGISNILLIALRIFSAVQIYKYYIRMVSIAFVYVPEGIEYVVDQLLEDLIQVNLERLVKNVASLITLKNKGEIFLQYL